MIETWYVLEDGRVVDPSDCAVDGHGVMRYSDRMAVAMRGNAYSSRGVDAGKERAKSKKPEPPPTVVVTDGMAISEIERLTSPTEKDMEPQVPRPGYKTRDSRSK